MVTSRIVYLWVYCDRPVTRPISVTPSYREGNPGDVNRVPCWNRTNLTGFADRPITALAKAHKMWTLVESNHNLRIFSPAGIPLTPKVQLY